MRQNPALAKDKIFEGLHPVWVPKSRQRSVQARPPKGAGSGPASGAGSGAGSGAASQIPVQP